MNKDERAARELLSRLVEAILAKVAPLVHYPQVPERIGTQGVCRHPKFHCHRGYRGEPIGTKKEIVESNDLREVTCLRCLRRLAAKGIEANV